MIGREFEFRLLHHVSGLDEVLAAEGVKELIRRRVLHGVGERFDFTHHRLQAVVYGRLLLPRRKLLHRRVGEALEALPSEDPACDPLALGLHFREGEVWDKAVVHLRRAGARAVERSANREAAACFERALAALAHLPESHATLDEAFEIRLELRSVLNLLDEVRQALECLREAERLAERLNDEGHRGLVCAIITNFHTQLGELDEALVTGARALEIALRLVDLGLRVLATSYLEQAQYFRGEYTRAVELATENLAVLPADRIHEHFGLLLPASVYVRAWLVMTFAQLGRFAEATEYATQTCRLAELTHGAYTLGVVHRAASNLYLIRGDWAKARSLIERWIAVLRTGKVALLLPDGFAFGAYVMARLGEASEALNRLREGEELVERQAARGTVAGRGWAYHALGRASLLLGRFDDAQRLGERAVEYSSQQLGFNAHPLHLLGDVATHPDRFDAERGEACYGQALSLGEPRGMRPLIAHCHLGLGKLYRRTDKREQAQEHLATATTMYRDMGMTYWLEKAEADVANLGT